MELSKRSHMLAQVRGFKMRGAAAVSEPGFENVGLEPGGHVRQGGGSNRGAAVALRLPLKLLIASTCPSRRRPTERGPSPHPAEGRHAPR